MRELAARQAVVHILMEHGVSQAKTREASQAAGQQIESMGRTIAMNRKSLKACQDELLGHVGRMAAMEE